jgi:hypothetical protein
LSDDGRPAYDANHAGKLAALGCPVFACTPDLFPDLMAAALRRDDIADRAAAHHIALVRERMKGAQGSTRGGGRSQLLDHCERQTGARYCVGPAFAR